MQMDTSCIQVLVKHDSLHKFSRDHLLNYLESIWDCSVKELKVASMGNAAVICFTEAQDFTTLQKTCSEKPLEDMVLEVKRTFEGGVVMVSNPLPTTTNECFMYYFKNTRRSGGDQSARIMKRDSTHKFLLVHFSSKEVAEKVLQCTHHLEDTQLELKAFDPDLDSLPSEQELEHAQRNLSAADSECQVRRDLESTSSFLDHNMHCHEPQKQQEMTANENCTRYVEGMCRVYRGIIEVLSEVDLGLFQDVSIKEEGDELLIEGKSQVAVENIDNLLKTLVRMQATSKYLSKVGEEFTEWDEIFMKIREKIDEFSYTVCVQDAADDSSAEEICIKTCESFISIDQMLERFLTREDVSVTSHGERDLLTTTEWDRFLTEDLQEEFEGNVFAVYKETNNVIMVFAPEDLIYRAKSCVCQFLSNSYMTEFVELTEKEVW